MRVSRLADPKKVRIPRDSLGKPRTSSAVLAVILSGDVLFCPILFCIWWRKEISEFRPSQKEPSYISRKGRGTLCGTKQGLKIVSWDSAEGGAGQCPGPLQSLLQKLQKPVAYVMKNSGSETGRPGFRPH